MGSSVHTLVCVKQVKQEILDEWDENMPLPGDIIEGVAEEGSEEYLIPGKGRSELSSQLGKLNRQAVEFVFVKIRRGENILKIRACVVPEKGGGLLQRRFTIRAASDDRHVVVLGDLTVDQCTELQEMSRKVVNVDDRGFSTKGVKYDWRKMVDTYLPDHRSTLISSILFMPLAGEHNIGTITTRTMAWFSATISSGIPLIFVNIQTEQVISPEKTSLTGREASWGKQHSQNSTVHFLQGIRLWFLPGVEEVALVLTPEVRETRFGMDIKRTPEGFICVNSVAKGSAADRAGLKHIYDQGSETGHLVVISRLEGKSLMPSVVSTTGLIKCCDNGEVRDTLVSAIDMMDNIHIHVIAWSAQKNYSPIPHKFGAATLRPPKSSNASPRTFCRNNSAHMFDQDLISYPA
ncbi:hypothetical protein GIB67_006014 [Kingdonia uniflora]|uniref:Uncharacterized protein n=1 Tax=Kingdonia uniflora TaxID=39325 RepID=A0A7J7MC52_9MAGN|nr:hypothetical protein GIB67_006014 [Kingdonia uniflora]